MIPERQTGGLRKPHTAGGSARPRGPRGRAVAWGTATAGPWPVPGTSRSRRREPTVLPAWGETGVERKTSDEPARPCPKAPRERRAPRGASSQRRSFRGVSCPPAHGPPAPPGRVCLSPLRPQRPERRPRVLGTHYGNERPSGGSCRDSDSEAGGRRGRGSVRRRRLTPPTRFQKAAYPHTRLRGSARAREPRPAPAAEDAWAAGTV